LDKTNLLAKSINVERETPQGQRCVREMNVYGIYRGVK